MGVSEREIFSVVLGSIQAEAAPSFEEGRALEYLKALPSGVKSDAVALLETLWRRHNTDAKMEASEDSQAKKSGKTGHARFLAESLDKLIEEKEVAEEGHAKLLDEFIEEVKNQRRA
jgi:hypothetical protein